MPDFATLNRAAQVLRRVAPDLPADAALRTELFAHRRLSPVERRDVTRAVFAYYRWQQWLEARDSLQRQLAAALEWQGRFDANPASIKPAALAARAVPAWLREEVELSTPDLRQLQREPALWLRARPGAAARLATELGDCAPPPAALASKFGFPACGADALRYTGSRDLFRTEAFQTGLFEIQDLASQLVGQACAPQPGETWWDACAGEGGKTLHLADLMQNRGLLWATDRSLRRLAVLKTRAARARVFNYRTAPWDGSATLPTKTKFDGILVDAPCSGVGTWQRNPHARWTTSPADVRELAAMQRSLLEHVVPALKPGGRLIYAVCTLTRSETSAVAEAFTPAHADLEPAPLPLTSHSAPDPSRLFLHPHELDANGMFVAAWRKK